VHTVAFTDHGLVIGLRRRRRRLCCPCGAAPQLGMTPRGAGGGTSTSVPAKC